MDLNHLFDIGCALFVAWVASVELRYRVTHAKLEKLQQKERDDAITKSVVNEPDSDVNRELAKVLGRRDPGT